MSDPARASAQAIAALLGGLGQALADAQEDLAQSPPVDAFGRPLPSYRIPEIDFRFEIEAAAVEEGRWWDIRPKGGGAPSSVTSHVSGRIVAVPPNAGLPETLIEAAQGADALELRVSNAAGEILAAAAVEVEIDIEASGAIHGTSLSSADRLALLGTRRIRTGADGVATVALDRSRLQPGQGAVVLIRSEGAERRVSVVREG
jgi:hypothetical protein